MTGIELYTGGPLFHAESRLVRALAEPQREQAAEPTNQTSANT